MWKHSHMQVIMYYYKYNKDVHLFEIEKRVQNKFMTNLKLKCLKHV